MSDWRSRAKRTEVKGDGGSAGSWKERAQPVSTGPSLMEQLANPSNQAGTALQHFGQGASFGLTDELSGAAGAQDELGRRFRSALGFNKADYNRPIIDPSKGAFQAALDRYRLERDSTRADLKKGAETNPKTAFVSEIAGALAVPLPGPGKAKAGASLLSRAGQYGLQGAGVGAAYGLGTSDADLTKGEFGKMANDVSQGAQGGYVGGALGGPALEKAAGVVSNYLLESAADKAFRAMNGNAKIVNKARKMGFATDEDMRKLGRWALENNLIPWSGDTAEIVSRADAILDKVGPRIGDISKRADEQGVVGLQRLMGDVVPVNGEHIGAVDGAADYGRAYDAAKGALDPMSLNNMDGLTAGELRTVGPVEQFLQDIQNQAQQTPGSFEGMHKLKSSAQKTVKWGDEATSAQQIHRDAVQRYTGEFEDMIGESLGKKTQADLKSLNRDYANSLKAHEFATDAVTRQGQQKYSNPLAKVLRNVAVGGAGAGAATSEPLLLAASGGAYGIAKLLDNPAIMARVFNAAGKAGTSLSPIAGANASKLTAEQSKMIADWLMKRGGP